MGIVANIPAAFFCEAGRQYQKCKSKNISWDGEGDEEKLDRHFGADRNGRKNNG